MLFLIGILIIVLLNIDTTKSMIPLNRWHGTMNLVAVGLILFWAIRSGALTAGGV